jgi:hypothetical protein
MGDLFWRGILKLDRPVALKKLPGQLTDGSAG